MASQIILAVVSSDEFISDLIIATLNPTPALSLKSCRKWIRKTLNLILVDTANNILRFAPFVVMKHLGTEPVFTSQVADNTSTMIQNVQRWQKDRRLFPIEVAHRP